MPPNEVPKMSIQPMNSDGIFQIDFNVDMLVPKKIDQKLFNKIFDFTVISTKDNSKAHGVFGSTKKERRLF